MVSANIECSPSIVADRILVIRYRFIGDTILTVPFLRNLRRAYPHAIIDVLVGPQSGEVLKGCPYVNELITFDTTRFHKYDQGSGVEKNFWSYVWQLKKRSYQLAFVLKRSWSSALLAFLIGAKYRVGYATEGRQILLTHSVPWNNNIHEVKSTLDVLQTDGVPVFDSYLEAWISDEEQESIMSLVPELSTTQPRILIHAAAAHPDKLYPLDSWAKIINDMHRKWCMLPFFTGASEDRVLYERLIKISGIQGINLAGRLDIRQSMALYKQMNLAVCVDSGPAHLCAAVGTPTVSIFGPTDPQRWRPYGSNSVAVFDSALSCRPCHYQKTCVDRPCLTSLDPQIVIDACSKLYERHVVTSPLPSDVTEVNVS